MATGHGKPPWRLDVSFGLGGKVPLGLAGDGTGFRPSELVGREHRDDHREFTSVHSMVYPKLPEG